MEIFNLKNIQEGIKINTSTLSFQNSSSVCESFDFNVDATLKVFKRENNEVVFNKTKENFSIKKINEFIKSDESEVVSFSTQGFGVYRAEMTITGKNTEDCFRKVIFTDFEIKELVYKNPILFFQILSSTFEKKQENNDILFVDESCLECNKQHSIYFNFLNIQTNVDPNSDIYTKSFSVYPIIDGVERKDLARLITLNSSVNIDFNDHNYYSLIEAGIDHTLKFKIEDGNIESQNIIIRKISHNIQVTVNLTREVDDIVLTVNSEKRHRDIELCKRFVELSGKVGIYKNENGNEILVRDYIYNYFDGLPSMDNFKYIVYKINESDLENGDYWIKFEGTLIDRHSTCSQLILATTDLFTINN